MPETEPSIPSTEAPEAQADRDLYCFQCGYNLRGLSGDPRRCPECGHDNPLSELTLPADMIASELRRMETAPTLCTGAVVFVLPFLSLLSVFLLQGDTEPCCCCGTPILVGVMGWFLGMTMFRSSCREHEGWRWALAKCHAYGLSVVLPMGMAMMVTASVLGKRLGHRALGDKALAALIAVDGCLLVVACLAGRWARRRIKETISPLQRDTAIRIARERVASAMRRGG